MGTTQIAKHANTLATGEFRGLSKWHADAINEARRHGRAMVRRLVHLANHAASEAVQRQAASDVLDRAYGKPHQAVSLEGAAPRLLVVVVDAAADPAVTGGPVIEAIEADEPGAVSIEPSQTKIPDFP